MLAFHIVAIGLLAALVWAIAYGQGKRTGERQLRRRLAMQAEAESAEGSDDPITP